MVAFAVDCLWQYRVKSGPGSGRKVRALYYNIRGLHANLDELAVAGSDYDVLVCAESKVSDRRHLLIRLHIIIHDGSRRQVQLSFALVDSTFQDSFNKSRVARGCL